MPDGIGAAVARVVHLSWDGRLSWPSRRPSRGLLVAGVVLLLAVLVCSVRAVDADSASDVADTLRGVASGMLHWRWQFAAVVVLAAGAHYGASAVAARAASGLALPLGESSLVQLAAAAANRISAAGLGGSAVNIRYFTHRGLAPAGAVGAVAALGVLGGVADLLVLAAIVTVGPWLGLTGAASAFSWVGSLLGGAVSPLTSSWVWAAAAAFAVVGAGLAVRGRAARLVAALRGLWAPASLLMRSPRRLVTLLAASAATTMILALAFVASVWMMPGAAPHVGVAALIVSFMLGSAAGNAVPVPAGVGSTETALVAVLVAAGIPVAHAVGVVLAFRVVTFWLPPVAGLLALRRLVRLGAL